MTGTQRFVTVVFIFTSGVLLSIVSVVATRPKLSVLYSGLQSDDASSVVSKLQEKKIPYEIDGTAIKVPDQYIAETRMELAGQGIPRGGNVGFEIFDKTNIGMTEFAQKLNYQRGLQGELSRSINEVDGVMESRVHLALPEESIFSEKEREPSASVVVKLRAGSTLNTEQVAGVVHLVSSAVEGLKPGHVDVIDTSGNVLSEGDDEASGVDARMSSSEMAIKHSQEHQMEKDIQSMLEKVLGPNKAVVRVNARMNFDRKESNSEIYQPINATKAGVLTDEVKVQENYAGGSGASPAAAPKPAASGTTANSQSGNGYERLETNDKYEVSKTTRHIVESPGQVEKISVAVMVDGKVDASKLPAIKNAVTMAAGIDASRGDRITVESVEFDDSAAKKDDQEMQALASKTMYLSLAKTVGAGILLLVFMLMLKGMLSHIRISMPESVVVKEIPMGQIPSTHSAVGAAGVNPALQYAAAAGAAGPGNASSQSKVSVSEAKPEEVAQVLRKWMSEN
jgi:flagellar M-ring protein FliF